MSGEIDEPSGFGGEDLSGGEIPTFEIHPLGRHHPKDIHDELPFGHSVGSMEEIHCRADADRFLARVKVAIIGQLEGAPTGPVDTARSWLQAFPQYAIAHLREIAEPIAIALSIEGAGDHWDDLAIFNAVGRFMKKFCTTQVSYKDEIL
jgi:hypothetical protein